MIVIINYGMGNLRSVEKKVSHLDFKPVITNDIEVIKKATKIILPGVGHFATGVKKLKESGIWDVLNKKVVQDKTPVLGICLGMQLMCKHSEEGDMDGFGWFDADVKRFRVNDKVKFKIPHMGWNQAQLKKDSPLFADISSKELFYFVHSYHVVCHNHQDVLATTEYSYEFVSAIQKSNMYGTQFHPEKSHDWGEKLLSNFLKI